MLEVLPSVIFAKLHFTFGMELIVLIAELI